jgi:hypothetical protein
MASRKLSYSIPKIICGERGVIRRDFVELVLAVMLSLAIGFAVGACLCGGGR